MIEGYARVSTDGQSLDAQVKRLRAAGAEEVWRETASGAKSDRVQLRRILAQLGPAAKARCNIARSRMPETVLGSGASSKACSSSRMPTSA